MNLIQNMAFTPISEWELIAAKLACVMPAEVNMTLSSFMKDELVNSHQIVILGAKNQSSSEYRKMTALEFHCRQGHRGSVRSSRGRKYAYTFVDMGPTTYQEGFTMVQRSDLYDAFFPMIVKLRCRFQRRHNYSLCAELLVDKSNQISNQKSKSEIKSEIKSKLCKRAFITAAHVQHGIERIRDGRSPMRRQNACIQGLQYQQNCTLQTSRFSLNDAEWSG